MPIYDKEDIAGFIYKDNQFFCVECFDEDREDPEDFTILLEDEIDKDKIYSCDKCKKHQ